MLRRDFSAFMEEFVCQRTFGIWPPPARTDLNDDRQAAKLFRALIRTVGNGHTVEERLFALAYVFHNALIFPPKQILPTEIYDKFTRRARNLKGFSFTDFKYHDLVGGWVPYFDRLLKDRGRGVDVDMEGLSALGHEEEAMKLLLDKHWRSAVPLACAWLAQRSVIRTSRKNPDVARTLENAYSRGEIRQAQRTISDRDKLDHSHSA